MPIPYLRSLTSPDRSERTNRHLARYLALVAGAEDAAGLLALHRYTSHMSGVTTGLGAALAMGTGALVVLGGVSLCSFLVGSVVTTLLIRWGHARGLRSRYALPLVIESAALAVFALGFRGHVVVPFVGLLCFAMGMQNAMITKISDSVIRTTHVTGIVTDLGICLGRLGSALVVPGSPDLDHAEERSTLLLLGSLFLLFLSGGIVGTLGYRAAGNGLIGGLAAVVLALAIVPVLDDMHGAAKASPAGRG